MKRHTPQQPVYLIKIIMAIVAGAALLMISLSFTVNKKKADDFLNEPARAFVQDWMLELK